MAVPKRKKSKSKRNMHRSHNFIYPKNIVLCPTTGEFMLSHSMAVGGTYKGKRVFIKQHSNN
ncbi:MAG: 50S ribosomal protein L32 [Wolbachia endosymbiont of Menacanthus eurysternus]|nr:MAG: 50S ribosomal protein L32 [Wolbachia endosymbiont of Menacanthus eurysternus]